jgi:UV DNA damage endonuclease
MLFSYFFKLNDSYRYSIDFAKDALKSVGDLANKYGHRLVSFCFCFSHVFIFVDLSTHHLCTQKTMHPGQYNQLVSPTQRVVDNTIRELDCKSSFRIWTFLYFCLFILFIDHAQMMDLMGLPADSIMIM